MQKTGVYEIKKYNGHQCIFYLLLLFEIIDYFYQIKMHLKLRQVVCIFLVTVYDAACHSLLLQCRGSQLVPICMEHTSDSKMRVNNRQIVLKSSSRRLSRLGSIYNGPFFFFFFTLQHIDGKDLYTTTARVKVHRASVRFRNPKFTMDITYRRLSTVENRFGSINM